MISKEEVKHIAKLARLELGSKEVEKFRKELSEILDYVKKLNEVNIEKVKPTTHPLGIENIFREDKAAPQPVEMSNDLIEAAPEKKERYIRVKAVL